MNKAKPLFAAPVLPDVSTSDFKDAISLLHKKSGIVLGEHKRDMAERSLALRAKALELPNVSEYLKYLNQNPTSAEWDNFINSFTINHTAFFREEHHFDILARFIANRSKPINVWSASCSTGEEPYSIAMQLSESVANPGHQVTIAATDIDTDAIAVAQAGIYTIDRVRSVPDNLLKKYFQRGTGTKAGMARVKANIRNMVNYSPLNLIDPRWPFSQKFDAIFCRNTLIYFDKDTQAQILNRFATFAKPGGLLFAGHSENLTYITDAWRLLGQTVYEVK